MKNVIYTRLVLRDLRRHGKFSSRIFDAVAGYAADQTAHANNVKQMAGSPSKRLRVGDFRVVFEETDTTITVTKVGPRGSVYD